MDFLELVALSQNMYLLSLSAKLGCYISWELCKRYIELCLGHFTTLCFTSLGGIVPLNLTYIY